MPESNRRKQTIQALKEAAARAEFSGEPVKISPEACRIIIGILEDSGWISVKARLPEDGRDVLAYYNHPVESRIVPVNYYNDVWFDCVFNRPMDIDIDYITHWMPLPEGPQ